MTFGYVAACDDTWGEERMPCRAHTTLMPALVLFSGLSALQKIREDGWSVVLAGPEAKNVVRVRCPSHGRILGPLVGPS